MERLHSLWIVILLCATNVCSQEKCPEKCVCIRGSTVRCMFLQLDRVPSGIPSTTTVLDLRFNRIRNIPRGTFKELGKITTLLINNNQIQSLENGAFEGLSKLRYLRLDSNLLSCDCNMKWLSTFLRTNTGKIHATAACHSPANLKGRQLSQLTDADFGCDTPHFTMEPRDAIITMGNTAYFSCRAEGKASYKISWLHNDAEVNLQDNRVSMLNDGTLMIHNTVDSDKGTYQCVVRTPNQEIRTNKVQLTYSRAPPSMLTTPSDVSGQVGRSVRLSCQATGIPPPTITWKFNDNTIIPGRKHAVDTVGNLDITNLQTSDQGVYTCQASNAEGFAVSHARVTVQGEAPVLVQQPSDLSLTEGDTARFTCDVSGNPRPNITWFKGNTEVLSTERRIQIVNEGRQLRIVLLQSTDRGTYTCRGENSGGTVQGSARLTVTQTAVPTNNREHDTEGGPGEDITLLCAEDGDPLEATRWIRNGATISPGPKYSLQGNRLTIRRLAQSDFGRYECFPENTLGFARNVVNLNVRVREIQTNYSGHSFVNPAIQQATNRVDVAINQTIKNLFNKNRTHSVQDLITIFRYPSADALRLARAEEIFEQTLDIIQRHVDGGHKYNLSDKASSYKEILSPGHLELIANMSGCFANPRIVRCSEMCYHKRFRSMDGLCNNLHSPTWGASVIALQRMLPPIYENGFNTPVGWNPNKLYNGYHLPSPRLVSSFLMSTDHVTMDEHSTHMLMQWGQFLDHDMSLTPQSVSNARFSDGRYCNETCENQYPCFPITVPRSDTRIQHASCLGFSRSSAICNSGSTSVFYKTFAPRQQINAITAFIDASSVYGSSDFEAQRLREFSNGRGLLRVGVLSRNNKRLLPFDTGNFLHHFDCQIEPSKRHVPCFRAGDNRVNEHLALTAMHTLWVRHHNYIATELLEVNPHWDGNILYHETRKILGAMMQHISYKFWLPQIIGKSGMEKLGSYNGYDSSVDPSIANEFATAAFRFGHSLVQPIMFRLNESFAPIPEGNLPLHKAFFSPYKILEEGGIDPLLRGLFGMSAKKRMPEEVMNKELTEKLFSLANAVGQDLASLNIQRGRDHGLPFYNEYRHICGLSRATSFDDLASEMPQRSVREKLQALYGHPDNIDLFVGGMAEKPLDGGKVGPTFLCIIVDQFKRARDGDRFWYENPGVFEPNQLAEIKQVTLAQIMCESSDGIQRVQRDVFVKADSDADYLECSKIPKLNLKVWSECCTNCEKSGNFQSLTNHFRRGQNTQFSHREDREHNTTLLSRPSTDRSQIRTLNDQMSVIDSKFSKMENEIRGLTKTVVTLKRKLKKVNKYMRKTRKGCYDNKGQKRKNLDRWTVNNCKTCACRGDQVECTKQTCPVLPCASPRTVVGRCCPIC
ncbi:peroxidasin homolog isoform X4 [Ostrea edulis]|uniref:peroxidasin homolog isoform X4 n=1 Tax=Ostrea edulis TaxID=37623 RepID=UPI0024AF7F7B|nr:peroxidasin homolog isoform X4 [Ostrea edulis]